MDQLQYVFKIEQTENKKHSLCISTKLQSGEVYNIVNLSLSNLGKGGSNNKKISNITHVNEIYSCKEIINILENKLPWDDDYYMVVCRIKYDINFFILFTFIEGNQYIIIHMLDKMEIKFPFEMCDVDSLILCLKTILQLKMVN